MPYRYRYHPVTRIITVEFRPLHRPKGRLEVTVTPEHAVVRSGDLIQWNVQGLPARADVSVGNFIAHGGAATVKLAKGRVRFGKASVMKAESLKTVKGVLSYDTKNLDLDAYKYDILVDGHVVVDPDIEIRGPRA